MVAEFAERGVHGPVQTDGFPKVLLSRRVSALVHLQKGEGAVSFGSLPVFRLGDHRLERLLGLRDLPHTHQHEAVFVIDECPRREFRAQRKGLLVNRQGLLVLSQGVVAGGHVDIGVRRIPVDLGDPPKSLDALLELRRDHVGIAQAEPSRVVVRILGQVGLVVLDALVAVPPPVLDEGADPKLFPHRQAVHETEGLLEMFFPFDPVAVDVVSHSELYVGQSEIRIELEGLVEKLDDRISGGSLRSRIVFQGFQGRCRRPVKGQLLLRDPGHGLAQPVADLFRQIVDAGQDVVLLLRPGGVGKDRGLLVRIDELGRQQVIAPDLADAADEQALDALPDGDLPADRLVDLLYVRALHPFQRLLDAAGGENVHVLGLLDADRQGGLEAAIEDLFTRVVLEIRDQDPVALLEGQYLGGGLEEKRLGQPGRAEDRGFQMHYSLRIIQGRLAELVRDILARNNEREERTGE